MQRLFVENQDNLVINDDIVLYHIVVELEEDDTIESFYSADFGKMYVDKKVVFVKCIGQTANCSGEELLGAAFYNKQLSGSVYHFVV